jgi:hypothetical protein
MIILGVVLLFSVSRQMNVGESFNLLIHTLIKITQSYLM